LKIRFVKQDFTIFPVLSAFLPGFRVRSTISWQF